MHWNAIEQQKLQRSQLERYLHWIGQAIPGLGQRLPDTPLQHWAVFTHEIHTKSGKHRHQGGLVIYVIDGKGYSVINGERVDWEKGDLVLLPLEKGGVEHQHFNSDPAHPALWIAFIHFPLRDYVASEMTQLETAVDYRE